MHWTCASSTNILTRGTRLIPVLLILLIHALHNVLAEPKLTVDGALYKCYDAKNCDSSPRVCRNKWETCEGTTCLKVTHVNTGSTRLRCDNSSEPGQFEVGKCVSRTQDTMPDQKEEICACRGDYCNQGRSSTAIAGALPCILLSLVAAFRLPAIAHLL